MFRPEHLAWHARGQLRFELIRREDGAHLRQPRQLSHTVHVDVGVEFLRQRGEHRRDRAAPQRTPESEDALQILRVRDDDQIARAKAHVLQTRRVRFNGFAEFAARDRNRRAIRFEVDDRQVIVVPALQRDSVEERVEVVTVREVEHRQM
jgi:hypothetical protein